MASTTSCPTVNATTPCPTTGYRFEPTGTYNPTTMPSNWYNNTPFDAAPFFPPTKTYSSIFNRDTAMPSPMVNMPMMPPMMMPTSPVPTTMPPMMPPMTPVMTPFMTPVTPMTCPVPVPVPVPTAMPSWCYSPMTTPFGLPTTFPMTYPTVTPMTPTYMPFDAPMTTPFGMPTTYPMMSSTTELCSVGCRPSNPVEMYCLTNPIRVCDREGNRMLCLNFDFRGYKPEEITVTLNKTERCITIEATHEVKEGKEHHVMRKFSRKFVLPTELAKIDLAKCEIKSCLTVEGCLCIEMPLPKMTTEEIAKCPIMSRAAVSPLFNTYYKCPSVVYDTKPVACKIN